MNQVQKNERGFSQHIWEFVYAVPVIAIMGWLASPKTDTGNDLEIRARALILQFQNNVDHTVARYKKGPEGKNYKLQLDTAVADVFNHEKAGGLGCLLIYSGNTAGKTPIDLGIGYQQQLRDFFRIAANDLKSITPYLYGSTAIVPEKCKSPTPAG